MKNTKKMIFLMFVFLCFSCDVSFKKFEDDYVVEEEKQTFQENTKLFIKDESNELVEKYNFFTQDKKFLSEVGFTLWTTPNNNDGEHFNKISFYATKSSGAAEAGYGLVFARQIIDDRDFMLTVLINTKNQFIIGKVIDGTFLTLSDWQESKSLISGLGVKNLIEVLFDEEKEEFVLSFNQQIVQKFSIEEKIFFDDAKYGFAVVISDREKFNICGVDVTFEKANLI